MSPDGADGLPRLAQFLARELDRFKDENLAMKKRLARVDVRLREQYAGSALPPDSPFYDGIAHAYQILVDEALLPPNGSLPPRPPAPSSPKAPAAMLLDPPPPPSPLSSCWRIVQKGPPTTADTEVLEGLPSDDVRVTREAFGKDQNHDPICVLRVHNRMGAGDGQRIARITLSSVHQLDLAFARHMAEAAYAFFAKNKQVQP